MQSKGIGFVACRVLALYGLMVSFKGLGLLFAEGFRTQEPPWNGSSVDPYPFWVTTLPLFLHLLFVCILWFKAESIGSRIGAKQGSEYQTMAPDLYVVAFTVIGIWIVVDTLPSLVFTSVNYWYTVRSRFPETQIGRAQLQFIDPVLKLVLACGLLIGGQTVAKLVGRVRG
jgi:hypothetical protein